MIMNHNMATEASRLTYLDVGVFNNGDRHARVQLTGTEVEFHTEPLPGTAIVDPRQMGTCASEIGYYLGNLGNGPDPSRFMQDSGDASKQALYLERNLAVGFTSDPEDIRRMMVGAPFHEGWGIVQRMNPNPRRPSIPVQMYIPVTGDGTVHLERRIEEMNFQNGFSEGRVAVYNPADVCDLHSSANNIDPTTGWPHQCNRDKHVHNNGYQPKATRGHTELGGTSIKGITPVRLDTMTPLSERLSDYILADERKRGIIATSVEPFACVFQAHGPMLQKGEIPGSIAVIGDGPNSLLMMLFYQIYAPDAKIVVVGKNQAKLDVIRQVNPEQIRTVMTDGRPERQGYDDLSYALEEVTGKAQADLVIPTVTLPEETVEPFVKKGGMAVYWAASMSENKQGIVMNGGKHYRQFHSYGGAPRAEFSAAAGFDWLLQHRPDSINALTQFPGIFYTDMNTTAARSVEQWLNNRGKFEHPENGLSSKIVVNMM